MWVSLLSEGAEAASLPEAGVLVTSPPRLPEALLEPAHILPPSQEPKVVMDLFGARGRMVQGKDV